MFCKRKVFLALCLLPFAVFSKPKQQKEMLDPIQKTIENHFQTYHKLEKFSAIQVSIKADDKIKTYTVGHRSHEKKTPLTSNDLFQIGSITKSYTASLLLLLEKKDDLDLDKPVKTYLNAFPNWENLTLTSLLNMSSGLPNYSDSPKINLTFDTNIKRYWSRSELIDLVYVKNFNPPLRKGYNYTNTGYILIDMILTEKEQKTFANLLEEKIIKPLKLKNTFYPVPGTNGEVSKRLVSGYAYNIYNNPELVGKDVRENNLSWAGAAGGIIANSEDIIHWVEELFLKDNLLSKKQKTKMQSLISLQTGKPIRRTSSRDPRGFGLGVIQAYDKNIGRFWYYQGETLGYRSLYMVVPCNKVIISALINSATNQENDKSGTLMMSLYKKVRQSYPKLRKCRS